MKWSLWGSKGAGDEELHPREKSCPIALPVDKMGFDDVVATMRHAVQQEYTIQRESFMDATLGNTAEARADRSKEQVAVDLVALNNADLSFAGADAFAASWLPGDSATIPSIPPREVMAARLGPHPLKPTEDLLLTDFMVNNDRLLSMTTQELQALAYLDGWLFKFALTRYFDIQDAAKRFLRLRAVIQKHNLTYTYSEDYAVVYNGNYNVSDMFAQYTTDPEFVLPPAPELQTSFDDEEAQKKEIKRRAKYPYRHHRTPIIFGRGRHNDYTNFSMDQCKKAWFYFVTTLAASDYYEQTHGHVTLASGQGGGLGNLSREFANFSTEAIQTVMPMKVQRVFICNQNWFVSNLISPLIQMFLSKKMRSRMITVTDSKYKEVVLELGSQRVSAEFGGTMPMEESGGEVLVAWLKGTMLYKLNSPR